MSVNCKIIQGGLCEITQNYKNGVHNGIDIVNKNYTLGNIISHSDGTVVSYRNNCNGFEQGSYGNYVKIKHDNGYYTLYAHMAYNTVKVKTGDRVSKGQVLGYMGNTGYSFGGHLHFEVRNTKDEKIDPTPYLNAELPNEVTTTGNITYKVYDNIKKRYLPEVINNTDYAGIFGNTIGGIKAKCQNGNIYIQSHILGGNWLSEISSADYNNNDGNSYSGIYGKPIDAVKIRSDKGYVTYRVHLKDGYWLPYVDSRTKTGSESYAGIYGKEIDAIEMY